MTEGVADQEGRSQGRSGGKCKAAAVAMAAAAEAQAWLAMGRPAGNHPSHFPLLRLAQAAHIGRVQWRQRDKAYEETAARAEAEAVRELQRGQLRLCLRRRLTASRRRNGRGWRGGIAAAVEVEAAEAA